MTCDVTLMQFYQSVIAYCRSFVTMMMMMMMMMMMTIPVDVDFADLFHQGGAGNI